VDLGSKRLTIDMSTRPPSSQPDMPPRAPLHPATLPTPPITTGPALHRSVRHAYPACPAPRLVATARSDDPSHSLPVHPDHSPRPGYVTPPPKSTGLSVPSASLPCPTTHPVPVIHPSPDYPPQRHSHACPSRLPCPASRSTRPDNSDRLRSSPNPTTHVAPQTSRHQPDSPTQPASPTAHPRQAISLRSGASPHDRPSPIAPSTSRSDCPTPPGFIPSLYDQPTHCDPDPSAPTTQLSPRHSLTAPTTQLSTSRDHPLPSRLPAPTHRNATTAHIRRPLPGHPQSGQASPYRLPHPCLRFPFHPDHPSSCRIHPLPSLPTTRSRPDFLQPNPTAPPVPTRFCPARVDIPTQSSSPITPHRPPSPLPCPTHSTPTSPVESASDRSPPD
jgi:hypothetical protein